MTDWVGRLNEALDTIAHLQAENQQLTAFAQYVADYSNDPGIVKAAYKLLGKQCRGETA